MKEQSHAGELSGTCREGNEPGSLRPEMWLPSRGNLAARRLINPASYELTLPSETLAHVHKEAKIKSIHSNTVCDSKTGEDIKSLSGTENKTTLPLVETNETHQPPGTQPCDQLSLSHDSESRQRTPEIVLYMAEKK